MTSIALFGAGGKMGYRLAKNLKGSRFDVRHVEVSEAGKARLQDELGLDCVPVDRALDGADVVILAVPDTAIGKVAAGIVDRLAPGTMVVALDAAAPFAGHLPQRADLTYFVTHPCHPPIFNDETEMQAKKDHFGGLFARQHIVSALMQGPEEAYGWSEPLSTLARLPEGSGQGVSDLDRLKSRTAQILEWEHGLLTPQFGPDENGAEATYCCDTDFDLEAAEQLWRNGYPTEAFLQGDTEGDYRLISAPKGSKGRIAAIFSKEHKLEFSEVEGKIEAVLSLTFNRAWGDFAQRSLALRLAAEAGELLGTIGRSLALAAQGIQRTVVLQVRLEAVGVVAVAMKPKLESSLAEVSAIGKLIGANLKTGDVRLSQLQGYEKGAFAPLAHERLSTPVTLTERTINNIRDQMPGAVAVKVLDFNVNARRPHWIGIEEAIGRRTYLPFLVLTFFVAGQSPVPRYLIASVFGMVITDSVDGIGHEAAAVVRAMERQGAGLFFGRGPDLGPDKAFTELARFMVQIASDAPEQAPVVPFEAIAAVDISNPPTLKWFTELSTTEKLLARGWLMSQSPVGYSNYERVLAVPFSAPHFDLAVSAATLVLGPDDCSLESVIASALALSLLIALGAPGTAAAQDLLASYRARVEEELGVDLLGDMEERLVDALSGIQERSIQAIRQALKGLARQIISEPSPAPAG